MSKPAFTPGEWRYDSTGGWLRVYGRCVGGSHMTEGDFPICDIRGWGHLQYLGEDVAAGIQDANAHLIAAAPSLYEACIHAESSLSWLVENAIQCGCNGEEVCGYHMTLNGIRAAITKATGEPA